MNSSATWGETEPTIPTLGDSPPRSSLVDDETEYFVRTRGTTRHREVRGRLFTRADLHLLDDGPTDGLPARPKTRGECASVPRPCPHVSCAFHLYLDVTAGGDVRLNFPDLEPGEMEHSCSLDIAAMGGGTLDDVGRLLNVTRERVRQLEEKICAKIQRSPLGRRLLDAYAGGDRLLPPTGSGGQTIFGEEKSPPAEPDEEHEEKKPGSAPAEVIGPPATIDSLGIVRSAAHITAIGSSETTYPSTDSLLSTEPTLPLLPPTDEASKGEPKQEEPAPPAKEKPLATQCTKPGCTVGVRAPKSGVELPGADMTMCLQHRCEALGMKRWDYCKAIKRLQEEQANGKRKKPGRPKTKLSENAAGREAPASEPKPTEPYEPTQGDMVRELNLDLDVVAETVETLRKRLPLCVEACAICNAIGWDTARALAAKIGVKTA